MAGREVRRVPANWKHPYHHGKHIPLYDGSEYLEDGNPGRYMPQWTPEQATHYQMYEVCSEGTPLSPVMSTPEELAQWLVDNKANACAGQTASYEAWLSVARGNPAYISMIYKNGKGTNGVEAMYEILNRDKT